MYFGKKGVMLVFVALAVLVAITGFFYLDESSGITGAVIGIQPANETVNAIPLASNELNQTEPVIVGESNNEEIIIPEIIAKKEVVPEQPQIVEDKSLGTSDVSIAAGALSSCQTISSSGSWYMTKDLSSATDCFVIKSTGVIVDCKGYTITYGSSCDGEVINIYHGINNSGGYRLTVNNCNIDESVLSSGSCPAIYVANSVDSLVNSSTMHTLGTSSHGIHLENTHATLFKNRIITEGDGAHGIVMNSSNGTIIKNNITLKYAVVGGNTYGIVLGTYSQNGGYINNNISGVYSISIKDESELELYNKVIYNYSDARGFKNEINWTLGNITAISDLILSKTIIIDDNLIEITEGLDLGALNDTAKIKIDGLSYASTPELLLVDTGGGSSKRCDNETTGITCNITYDATNGILYANISGFPAGMERYTTQAETNRPLVTFINPANGSNFSRGWTAFNVTTNDPSGISQVNLEFSNGTQPFNVTLSNNSGNWHANVNVSTLIISSHAVTVFSNDTLGNMNSSVNITIYVDRTAPNVTIITPTSGHNYSISSFNQTFNVSMRDTVTGVKNVSFSFDNSSGLGFNITAVNSSGYWSAESNVSALVEGSHIVTIYSYDYAGNLNNTEMITFTADFAAPNISIISPQGVQNYTRKSSNQTFEVKLRDFLTGVENATLSFDNATSPGFNATFTNNSGSWQLSYNVSKLAEGSHTATVFTYDYSRNLNNTEMITFTTDYSSPTFSNSSNISDNFRQNQNFTANITINDNLVGLDWYIFSTDASNSWSNSTFDISGLEYNASISRLISAATGTQVCWYYWANDTLGNTNQSANYCFEVQATPSAGGGNPSEPSSQVSETPLSAPTTTETTPTVAPSEEVETTENVAVSFSAPISTGSTSTGGGIYESEISIHNSGDKTITLDAKLKDDFVLENKEDIRKKLEGEGLSGNELEDELEALRLIEKLQVLQAHTGKVISFFSSGILKPTGNHVKANPLKNRLVNENVLKGIVVPPGQTFNGSIVLQKGLTLKPEDVEVVFLTRDKEVFKKDFLTEDIKVSTELELIDKDKKIVDLYILIPPAEGGGISTYSVEIDFNEQKAQQQIEQKIPLKVLSPFELFSVRESADTKLLGPYTVNLEKGALIAGQYEILKSGKFDVISRTYKGGTELVAENRFELDLS